MDISYKHNVDYRILVSVRVKENDKTMEEVKETLLDSIPSFKSVEPPTIHGDNKTYICVDSDGGVVAISDCGKIELGGCETIELDEALDHSQIDGFVWKDNKVEFSTERFERRKHENLVWELRNQREEECFAIVDRGTFWYEQNVNTEERKQEFEEWYNAWLNVTETLIVPEKPSWL